MDTTTLKLIAEWDGMAKYFVDTNSTVWCWAYGQGNKYINCGNVADFRANFTQRYRGKLVA
jgi:hypothetical protein